MFKYNEIVEFFNRIINVPDLEDEEVKGNIVKFYEYLELTRMCDDESLKRLSRVISCLDELLSIKRKMGYVDTRSLLSSTQQEMTLQEPTYEQEEPTQEPTYEHEGTIKLTKKPKPLDLPNHYRHIRRASSGNCGVTETSSNCGSVVADRC